MVSSCSILFTDFRTVFVFIVVNSDASDFLVYLSKDTTSDIYSVFTSVEDSSKTSVKNMRSVFAIIHAY